MDYLLRGIMLVSGVFIGTYIWWGTLTVVTNSIKVTFFLFLNRIYQEESADDNTEDFCAAMDFLSVQENVDPEKIGICGWGELEAAQDTRIKALVASYSRKGTA